MMERVSRRGKRKIVPPEEFYDTEFPNEYEANDNYER